MNGNYSSSEYISIYIHIPFCAHKCPYCHFYVVPDKEEFKDQLLQALLLEWQLWAPVVSSRTIASIYFGGGTPTLFGQKRLEKVLSTILHSSKTIKDLEVTIEANPENLSDAMVKDFRTLGINRVSIGVQSLDPEELAILDRRHEPVRAEDAVLRTYYAGIDNISIDLMYDVPKQTLQSWHSTLSKAAQLPITHLSLYNLTIEPHTPFARKEKELAPLRPCEETSLCMYRDAQRILSQAGLEQYEISAFCRAGKYSRHNTGYWTGREFLGFGPSAFSFFGGKRFSNVANLSRYAKILTSGVSPVDFEEEVTRDKRLKELFVLRLRLISGITLSHFEKHYGKLDEETYKGLHLLQKQGLIDIQQDHVQMTQKGILFYDSIASELI